MQTRGERIWFPDPEAYPSAPSPPAVFRPLSDASYSYKIPPEEVFWALLLPDSFRLPDTKERTEDRAYPSLFRRYHPGISGYLPVCERSIPTGESIYALASG